MITKNIFTKDTTLVELNQKIKEAKVNGLKSNSSTNINVAVLSNISTQYFVDALVTSLLFNGINAEITDHGYDQWEFTLNNLQSIQTEVRPDYTLVMLSSVRLILNPIAKEPDSFARYFAKLIVNYKSLRGGKIIVTLPESLSEGHDQTSPFYTWVKSIRRALERELDGLAYVFDIDPLIQEVGFSKWKSTKFLTAAKLSCHPNCYPALGQYVSNFLQSLIKRPIKLIIVDLDNTLWAGVVGDLGWSQVGLDQNADGYSHLMLQTYLLEMQKNGVLLAICSKNDESVAHKVFLNRPEMIIKLEHFVAQKINWRPKSENISDILSSLNLTTSGVMFLDDSKFEREEVRNALPDLIVPELPNGPDEWCSFLSNSGYMSLGSISDEDKIRSKQYFAEAQRAKSENNFSDYASFLKDLELVLIPEKVTSTNFDRVYDLIHKTNQFNLTTKRLTTSQLENLMSQDDAFCYAYRLKDKYSDYGIISVFIAEAHQGQWIINTWLMSCRAMGRYVENAVFEHFLMTCLSAGDHVIAEYVKTEKNGPVADLLYKMNFTQSGASNIQKFVVGENKVKAQDFIDIRPANI